MDAELIAAIEAAYNAATPGEFTVVDGTILRNGVVLDKAFIDSSAEYFAVVYNALPRLLALARLGTSIEALAKSRPAMWLNGVEYVRDNGAWWHIEKLTDDNVPPVPDAASETRDE